LDRGYPAAGIATDLGGRRLEPFEPAAADDKFGAEPGKTACHRGTKPGASAGDQDPLSCQQAFFKHESIPSDYRRPRFKTVIAIPAAPAIEKRPNQIVARL
jgi:hypothetical protein